MKLNAVFLQLRTLADLLTVYDLLEAGVRVGFEPVVGHLALTRPSLLEFGPEHYAKLRSVWCAKVETPREFIRVLFEKRKHTKWTRIDCPPEHEPLIRAIFEATLVGETYVRRTTLAKIVRVLAEHFGTPIDPQIPYGDPEWAEWSREKLGRLTCWVKPHPQDMREIIEAGVPGLINAEAILAYQSRVLKDRWFCGLVDGFMLPDKGVVRDIEGLEPPEAFDQARTPTGLGEEWDYVAATYQIVGRRVSPLTTIMRRKEVDHAINRHAMAQRLTLPADRTTVVADASTRDVGNPAKASDLRLVVDDVDATLGWIDRCWDDLFGIDLTARMPGEG